jgi:hypothetical protein
MRMSEIVMESTARTLYHGTLRKNVPSILAHGLWPSVGAFTSQFYGDDDGAEVTDLVFAANKDGLGKCISAIIGWLKQAGIPPILDNVLRHGAILIMREAEDDFTHRPNDGEQDYTDHPSQVEPTDYYSEYSVRVDGVLTGKKLLTFLQRQDPLLVRGIIGSPKLRRNLLIRMMIQAMGKAQAGAIAACVQAMDDDTVNANHKQMRLSMQKGLGRREAEDILMRSMNA